MKTVVFLGPSLPPARARELLGDATFLPPCALGDVLAALQRHRPQVIAIIDGVFECTPAVWHKEILYALSRGVVVFGGGSMGALRAAELRAFGMRGVGHSFEAFASGRLDGDDEVAVAHLSAEHGYRLLSEPLVNLRYGLELARAAGIVDEAAEQSLIAAMKQRHYPERSWAALYAAAERLRLPVARIQALRELVDARHPDRKAEDAVAVLAAVRAWRQAGAPVPAPVAFEPTVFWEHLVAYYGHFGAAPMGVRGSQLADYVHLGTPDRQSVLDQALCSVLARQAAERGQTPEVDDREAMARFRHARGLERPERLREWMRTQHLDAPACLELARDEARERYLRWRLQPQIDQEITRVMQRRGEFGAVLGAVRAQWDRLAQMGIDTPALSDVDSPDALMAWYVQNWGPIQGDLETHVVERGFGSVQQFTRELVARYLCAHPPSMECPT